MRVLFFFGYFGSQKIEARIGVGTGGNEEEIESLTEYTSFSSLPLSLKRFWYFGCTTNIQCYWVE